jgi:hypothetical protein
MSYNSDHDSTFSSLLQMWGLPFEIAKTISLHLAHIDNGAQDKLIRDMVIALPKKRSRGKERDSNL